MRTLRAIPLKALIAMGAALLAAYVWWGEYLRPVSFVDVVTDRAMLIDNVESYQPVKAFLLQLEAQELAYELERPRADLITNRLPFNVTAVKVVRYSDLEHSGELHVEFFNDRLVGTRFFPSDPTGYKKRMRSQHGIDLLTQSEVRISNTRVWSATDPTGRVYIGWEDVRLAEEMELWVKRYS